MAAAAAVTGHLTDVRSLMRRGRDSDAPISSGMQSLTGLES